MTRSATACDTSAAVSGGIAVVIPQERQGATKLTAFDVATGDVLWAHDQSAMSYGSPAIRDGAIYCGTDRGRQIMSRALYSGELRWSFDTDGAVYASVAVDGTTVYGGTLPGTVYALDRDG